MSQAPVDSTMPPAPRFAVVRRIAILLLLATIFTWVLHRPIIAEDSIQEPAGFKRGLIQGAMMPATFPYLMLGKDVPIYAEFNTGRTYKLGYTIGVNVCGAIFFGITYWRVRKWKKARDPK